MGHNCDCHHDHDHCGHDSHHDNYYFYGNYGGYNFCESDGTIVGTLFLILGIIIILVQVFG